MPTPLDNPYERAKLALSNILAGDPASAGRALTNPLSLSPHERAGVMERWFGPQWKTGPFGMLADFATDPFILVGAALTMAYPVAHATRLLAFEGKLGGYARRLFPGARYFSNMHVLYRGTDIPQLFEGVAGVVRDFSTRRNEQIGQLLAEYEKTSATKWSRATGVRIAAKLDGLDNPDNPVWQTVARMTGQSMTPPAIVLTPAERRVYDGMRGVLSESYREVMSTDANRKAAQTALRALGIDPARLGDRVEQYFPHIGMRSPLEAEEQFRRWFRDVDAPATERVLRGTASRSPIKQVTRNVLGREDVLLPNPDDLELAGLIDARGRGLLSKAAHAVSEAHGIPVRPYSLNMLPVLEVYHQGMARTKAWSLPPSEGAVPYGQRILGEERKLRQAGSVVEANMLADTYIPLATGRFSTEQAFKSMEFSEGTRRTADFLRNATWLPGRVRDRLYRVVVDNRGMTWRGAGADIQRVFYLGTIGGNPASAARNLMQTIVTTLPTLGLKDTLAGIRRTFEGTLEYGRLRSSGVAADAAFERAFPAFTKSQLDVSPISRTAYMNAMEDSYSATTLGKPRQVTVDKALGGLMWMFSRSERFNRLVAFEGAYAKAERELPGSVWRDTLRDTTVRLTAGSPALREAATHFAGEITRTTQFNPGITGTPAGMLNWWQPIRQFSGYSSNLLGFLTSTGTALGASEKAGFLGRNWGTLGRAMLASGLVYEGGRQLFDLDLSDALLTGGLPAPRSDGPLGMIPIQPPFLQTVAGALSGLATGDPTEFNRSLTLMIPGGIVLRRAVGMMSPGYLPNALGSTTADYEHPRPDGRVTVRDRRGNAIAAYTPLEMMLKVAGVGTPDEQGMMASRRYLMAQADRIRDMRGRMATALLAGDQAAIDAVQSEYQRAYPGLGPLRLRPSEVRAIQVRRDIPALQRAMLSIPVDQRPAFQDMLATALARTEEMMHPQPTKPPGLPRDAIQPPARGPRRGGLGTAGTPGTPGFTGSYLDQGRSALASGQAAGQAFDDGFEATQPY